MSLRINSRSALIQPRIERYAMPGIGPSLIQSNQENDHNHNNRNRINYIHLQQAGYTKDKKIWSQVYAKLGKKFGKENKGERGKHFAKTWNDEFKWLYLRKNNGSNVNEFDPAWICKNCNHYYARNPTAMAAKKNVFKTPLRLLADDRLPPQKKTLIAHQKAASHKLAVGELICSSDEAIWDSIHLESYFGIPARTHPFILHLLHVHGVDIGKRLHSPSTAKKMTIVIGSVIKAAVIKTLQSVNWLTFGSDGADVKEACDLFYLWVRCVVEGKPIQLFYAVRPEVRKLSKMLFDAFCDAVTGKDIEYGYDYKTKLEQQAIREYNEEVKQEEDKKTFKAAENTKILIDFDKQYPKSLRLGIICTGIRLACNFVHVGFHVCKMSR